MFCDNSLSTDLAFGAYKTEKTVNTQSGELRKQQTCVNSQENCNTSVQQLTRQGKSVVKNKCSIEASLNSIIIIIITTQNSKSCHLFTLNSSSEDIRKKSRQATGREYDNKRKANESDESREARLLAKHIKYEQCKLGGAQSSTKYCVDEKTIITSKQKQTNEEQDNTVRINDGHITISECSDNLKTQNVENVHQGELTKKMQTLVQESGVLLT